MVDITNLSKKSFQLSTFSFGLSSPNFLNTVPHSSRADTQVDLIVSLISYSKDKETGAQSLLQMVSCRLVPALVFSDNRAPNSSHWFPNLSVMWGWRNGRTIAGAKLSPRTSGRTLFRKKSHLLFGYMCFQK